MKVISKDTKLRETFQLFDAYLSYQELWKDFSCGYPLIGCSMALAGISRTDKPKSSYVGRLLKDFLGQIPSLYQNYMKSMKNVI